MTQFFELIVPRDDLDQNLETLMTRVSETFEIESIASFDMSYTPTLTHVLVKLRNAMRWDAIKKRILDFLLLPDLSNLHGWSESDGAVIEKMERDEWTTRSRFDERGTRISMEMRFPPA